MGTALSRRAQHAKRKSRAAVLAALPGIMWLLVFTLIPVLLMLLVSFWTSDVFGMRANWTLHNWDQLIRSSVYAELLLKTFRIALFTTFITLIVAYPMALFLARSSGMLKTSAIILLFLPFWIGYVVRTFAWLPILGRSGALNQVLIATGLVDSPVDAFLYNEGAVYLGLVYVYLLFMVLPIFLSLDRIDPALIEAATDLYARPNAVFQHVLLPLSLPGVMSGCVMVFLLALGAFVTPALLGGPSGIMFSNVIATQFLEDTNRPFGATLSLVMLVLVLAVLLLAGRKVGLQRVFLSAGKGN